MEIVNMKEENCKRLNSRYMEFAGILKEKGKGTMNDLNKLLGRLCLQEGIKLRRAREYLNIFMNVGLITFTHGQKRWKYNKDAEWELFSINV